MRKMIRRAVYLLRHRRVGRDPAGEIETHRLLLEEEIGGAASRRALGNTTLAREDARAQWIAPWVDSVLQDAVYALRMFHQAPAFTGAMVVVLTLGIGATTGVFTLVDALLLRSLPVPAADRLVYFTSPSFSYPIYSEVRSRSAAVFSDLAAWSVEDMHVAWATELQPASVLTASGSFYATLGITTTLGRSLTADDDQIGGGREGLVAVISHAAWQRRYG